MITFAENRNLSVVIYGLCHSGNLSQILKTALLVKIPHFVIFDHSVSFHEKRSPPLTIQGSSISHLTPIELMVIMRSWILWDFGGWDGGWGRTGQSLAVRKKVLVGQFENQSHSTTEERRLERRRLFRTSSS